MKLILNVSVTHTQLKHLATAKYNINQYELMGGVAGHSAIWSATGYVSQ